MKNVSVYILSSCLQHLPGWCIRCNRTAHKRWKQAKHSWLSSCFSSLDVFLSWIIPLGLLISLLVLVIILVIWLVFVIVSDLPQEFFFSGICLPTGTGFCFSFPNFTSSLSYLSFLFSHLLLSRPYFVSLPVIYFLFFLSVALSCFLF